MTKIAAYMILFALLSSHCIAQTTSGELDTTRATRENAQSRKAILIATNFMNDLFKGASSMDLTNQCTVPFLDKDNLILNMKDLKIYFDRVVNEFSQSLQKDHPRLDSAHVLGAQTGVFHGIIPLNIYVVMVNFTFTEQAQKTSKQAVFAVQMSDTSKIVGISN
jgi:hypothetical protein